MRTLMQIAEDARRSKYAVAKLGTNDKNRGILAIADTLMAHADACVGMAANMIGVRKRIIAFLDESGKRPVYTVMFNPEILRADGAYQTEEGCLSLLGAPRKCRRYQTVKVRYTTPDMQTRIKTYTGFTAQIIQHEIDHCSGVLI